MSGVGKGERKGQTHRASTRRPVCGGLIYATDNKRSSRGKDKAIPVQAWMGPDRSRRLRLPGFSDSRYMKVAMLSAHRTGSRYPLGKSLC
jgi:hypothetical protein